MKANIRPTLVRGVGKYVRSPLIAAHPCVRTRFRFRKGPALNVLVGSQMRRSWLLRCTNVSPERHSSAKRPPKRNRASGPCVPVTACANRSTAPSCSAMAAAAELASGMMSGSVTLRKSLHPKTSSVAGRLNRPKASGSQLRLMYRVMVRQSPFPVVVRSRAIAVASEAHIQTERPVGRRWRGLEVAHDPGGPFEVVGLGIDAAEPGAFPEIPACDREAEPLGSERAGPFGRELVGRRRLAQPDKRRFLDEAPLRAGRRLTQRDDARLLPQGRRRIHQTAAVVARLTADAVGSVELVKAALMVEQTDNAQSLVEQVEPGGVRHFPARIRVPHEHGGVPDRDLVSRDDPVSIEILVRVRPLPPPVHGVPDTV